MFFSKAPGLFEKCKAVIEKHCKVLILLALLVRYWDRSINAGAHHLRTRAWTYMYIYIYMYIMDG
jgi:hypothetical protein